MKNAPLRSWAANLQIPISQITSLASAQREMIDGLFTCEDGEARRAIGNHLVNFIDLIEMVAQRLEKEAEAIEIAAEF